MRSGVRDGVAVPDVARAAYRQSIALQEACGDDPFAHPASFATLAHPGARARGESLGVDSTACLAAPIVCA